MRKLIEVAHYPKSGKIQGGMSIRFYKGKKIPLYVDLKNQEIKTFIPFTGSERKCWDCGNNRELVIINDFNGNLIGQKETCDNS